MQAAIVCNHLERAVDCNKVRNDVVRSTNLYLSKHDFILAFHCQENESPLFQPRGSLAYISRENKCSKTVFRLILSEKKIDSPRKEYTSFPLVTLKCCCLPGILGKHTKFATIFVLTIDEIPAIFSNLEPGAQSKLAHAYYSFSL